MTDGQTESHRATVSLGAKQAGEIRGRWPWVEPHVWTDRMLTALEAGVKGGQWFSLIDKVYDRRNLESAYQKVKRNQGSAGVDHVTISQFSGHLERNLESLAMSLKDGSYRPQAIRRVWIPKPGSSEKRPLGIPTVRDRVAQGAVRHVLCSVPLLSNIYLDPLDHRMADEGYEMVRYADDFVILCRSREEAESALSKVESWTAAAGLQLHPDKTRVVDATEPGGFDFLGYHFERGYRWPSKKSLKKHKDAIRFHTRRANGLSLQEIIRRINAVRRGWFEYFKHSHWTTFDPLDRWVRMRLRSILRQRQGKRGRGRGLDHHHWPNAFFAEHGVFSYFTAYAQARQSS